METLETLVSPPLESAEAPAKESVPEDVETYVTLAIPAPGDFRSRRYLFTAIASAFLEGYKKYRNIAESERAKEEALERFLKEV